MALFPIPYPLINGVRYDFSSIEFAIDGVPDIFKGIEECNYSHTLEPKKVRGNRPQPIGRTRGEYTAEGDISMPKSEYAALIQALATKGAPFDQGFLEVNFDLMISYNELDEPPVLDVLVGCRIKKPATTSKSGGDAIMVKVELDVMWLDENGLLPVQPSKFLR